jgi:hypothetical protein
VAVSTEPVLIKQFCSVRPDRKRDRRQPRASPQHESEPLGGGFGTGLAIVGASVLAEELQRADGDFTVVFTQHAAKYRDYASVPQKVNAGRLLAPASRLGIRARNVLFSALALPGPLMKLVDSPAKDINLETVVCPDSPPAGPGSPTLWGATEPPKNQALTPAPVSLGRGQLAGSDRAVAAPEGPERYCPRTSVKEAPWSR